MKSIAIWYKSVDSSSLLLDGVELHFNFWKIPASENEYKRFLDIGVKLERTDCVENLSIYFPVVLRKESFTDVVGQFINNNDLVCAIFNENYKTVAQANSKYYKIIDYNDINVFNIYQLDTSDYDTENKFDGTILNIRLPKEDKKNYFRIRVDGNFCDSLISIQKPTNAFIQSAFSKIELTDFRINDARDLNKSLLEVMAKEKQLRIKKGHFFYMLSSKEEVLNYHAPFLSCRNLEKDKWNTYIGKNSIKPNEAILAYHWKESDVNHFNILIKSKYESNNWETISLYALVGFIVSMIIEILGNFFYDLIK